MNEQLNLPSLHAHYTEPTAFSSYRVLDALNHFRDKCTKEEIKLDQFTKMLEVILYQDLLTGKPKTFAEQFFSLFGVQNLKAATHRIIVAFVLFSVCGGSWTEKMLVSIQAPIYLSFVLIWFVSSGYIPGCKCQVRPIHHPGRI